MAIPNLGVRFTIAISRSKGKRRSMSSGEILFILAFIVLPTAVLVSSAWAVLFVRRRPDRVVEHRAEGSSESAPATADDYPMLRDTEVLSTVSVLESQPAAAPAESDWSNPDDEDSDVVEEELVDEPLVVDPVVEPEPDPEVAHEDEHLDSPAIVQTTDDLDAVVAEVKANEIEEQRAEELEPEPEPEPPIHETTELPLLPPREPAPEPEDAEETTAAAPKDDEGTGTIWRRRKRPAQLRPADSESARQRARGRDPQRQVPQLGRSARRRDGNQPDSAQDPEENNDTT